MTVAAKKSAFPPSAVHMDAALICAFMALFLLFYLLPYSELARTVWSTDEQGHGPIILAVSFWLIYAKRRQFVALTDTAKPFVGWAAVVFAVVLYAFGRSQDIISFTIASQIILLSGAALLARGLSGFRLILFPLFFLIFMIPLPEALVAAVTGPLKSAVSAVATSLLYWMGYPIGRSGVMMTVGPYQLLVADACAGLNSMFTLEALGMLYMNLMGYKSISRNLALAFLLVPTAFAANIVRVIILVLVTYHFGDEAGQGFVHGFAGMVLFLVALSFMLALDKLLGLFFPSERAAA